MRIAYLFDETTKEYLHPVDVHECPAIAGDYHKPVCSTWDKPIECQAREAAIFDGEKWETKPDYRGEFWFDESGALVEVKDLGKPQNLTEVAPPPTNAQQAAKVRAERDRLLAVNVDSINPVRYAAMTKAQHVKLGVYRQVLFDFTKQAGIPRDVIFPTLKG